ncbi:MAG: ATP-binding protein, partial [Actinomycetes bacterium]
PAQLLQRLDDRFALLTNGPRVSVRRQRSLQSMVDWSYDLCTLDEQRAWSLLSVFEGGFRLEAAEHVCEVPPPSVDGPADAPPVLDLVATLVDKSVLLREDQAGQVRYRMLETIRAYGLERLAESGAGPGTRARHRDWFVAYAERAGGQWFGPDQAGRVARLAAELANLRAAMRSALDEKQPRQALRVASSVWFYWLGWGSLEEGRRWLGGALAADAEQSRPQPPHLGRSHLELRVRSWRLLATLGAIHGDLEGAHQALLAARGEAAAGFGPRLRADGLRADALAAAIEHRHRRSIDLYLALLADPTVTADDPEATVLDLEVLVSVLSLLRQRDHAIAAARRALGICADHEEDWHRGFLLSQLGAELWLRGSSDAAREAGRESLSVAVALNHTFGVLSALEVLAWVAASTADLDRAAMMFGALAPLWRSIGAPPTGSGTVPVYHEMCRARLVEEMGTDAYEQAVRRGAVLGLDEAVGLGLGKPCRTTGRPARARRGHSGLTRRETEIADLVARGMTNGQIAATLVISPRTAEGHVQRILGKLGLRSRAGIAAWVAERRGRHPDPPAHPAD